MIVTLRNVRVLIYNGQDDFVVNSAGVINYLNKLQWEGIDGWKRARKERWTIEGQVKGWVKMYENMWFVLVNGAGHMVPADQPLSAFTMMGKYLKNDRSWQE